MIKQSVTLTEQDRDLLKSISMGNPKYKGKVSTGIKMLCNIFRAITKEKEQENSPIHKLVKKEL